LVFGPQRLPLDITIRAITRRRSRNFSDHATFLHTAQRCCRPLQRINRGNRRIEHPVPPELEDILLRAAHSIGGPISIVAPMQANRGNVFDQRNSGPSARSPLMMRAPSATMTFCPSPVAVTLTPSNLASCGPMNCAFSSGSLVKSPAASTTPPRE